MKLTEAQVGWLAGIVDGEGNFQLARNAGHLRAIVVVLTNTNPLLIETVRDYLLIAGIDCRVSPLSGGPAWQKEWKPAWSVQVGKIDSMKSFLQMIHPYLVAKQERAEILMKFLDRRRSYKPHARGRVWSTQEEELLALRMRELNQRGNLESVTTVRPPRENVMIQSELHGDMQSQTEMIWPELQN